MGLADRLTEALAEAKHRRQYGQNVTKECDACGYNTATHYHESPDYHDEGQGEYLCDECEG